MFSYKDFSIHWEGHGTVKIEDEGFTLVVDPNSKVSNIESADLILITQFENHHYDKEFVEKLAGRETCIVVPESVEEVDVPCEDVEIIKEDEVIDIFGIEIEATPLENEEITAGVGYRFNMRGTNFYVAGDMNSAREVISLEGRVDICFLPVKGTYTMDLDEIVSAAVRIKPDIVVPYHYGKPFLEETTDLQGLEAELEDRSIKCKVTK